MSGLLKHKVVIADPSEIFTEGLCKVVGASNKLEVLRTFTDYELFSEKAWLLKPDVVLFNPLLVSSHKRFAVRRLLKEHDAACVVAIIYSYISPDILAEFDGSVDLFDKPDELLRKLYAAIDHRSRAEAEPANGDGVDLSDREKEILVSVAQGMTNKEIADKHSISVHTVVSHRKNISRKTGIRTVSGLTVYAMLNKLLA